MRPLELTGTANSFLPVHPCADADAGAGAGAVAGAGADADADAEADRPLLYVRSIFSPQAWVELGDKSQCTTGLMHKVLYLSTRLAT